MDKLLSRALRAHNQAVRRAKRVAETKKKRELNDARREHAAFQRLLAEDRRQARFEEKEDHRLGPLRPRRAVGKAEIETLGAFDQSRIIPPPVPEEHQIKYWNIVEQDRVVILRGPDRHKIGTVKSIDKQNNTLTVEGLNMVCCRRREGGEALPADDVNPDAVQSPGRLPQAGS
jgi:large subunit ribosomal protein L24